MRHYAIWQAPFYSFWSKSFYLDVAENWKRKVYIYLPLLICFICLFITVNITIDTVDSGNGSKLTKERSVITLSLIDFIHPTEYDIKSIIQQQPRQTSIEKNNLNLHYEVNARKLGSNNVEHESSDIPNANNFIRPILILGYLVLVPFSYSVYFVQAFIYGLIGMLIARLNKVRMSYSVLVGLSTVALTPALLVDSLLKVSNFNAGYWSLSDFIITVGYLVFAIRANISSGEHTNIGV